MEVLEGSYFLRFEQTLHDQMIQNSLCDSMAAELDGLQHQTPELIALKPR